MGKEALEALARKDAALANERAPEANKIAEGERLARLKLEEKLAPRNLGQEPRHRIEGKLKAFPGTPYELGVNPVPEATRFLEVIDGVLRSSGWDNKESEKKDFRFVLNIVEWSKGRTNNCHRDSRPVHQDLLRRTQGRDRDDCTGVTG